ncbi:MAG: hypothetical protein IPI91_17210 [Flavobacteriales bacterium]|nr:hypothetical protein [Flavobacteriales bacterium]
MSNSLYALLHGKRRNACQHRIFRSCLGHQQMILGLTRYLWQVCNSEDLTLFAHARHQCSYTIGYFTTNSGIYFVEDHGGEILRICGQADQREHDAAQLATGGHFIQWCRGAIGIGTE